MANDYNTQSTPHPPKRPLFLSMDEMQAYLEIDGMGIDNASADAKDKIEHLAVCLATELLNFLNQYPQTPPAGLCLDISVLLPVWLPDWDSVEHALKKWQ